MEVVYEGYAPGGVALLVNTLTDNKNRTVANIRHIFSKYGGNMGENGSVSWMFERKGVIFIDPAQHSYESVEAKIFETDAEDILEEAGYIKIISSLEDFHTVEKSLENMGFELYESKIDALPNNEIEVDDFEKVLKFTKMLEAFDEDEDVHQVSSNEIIAPKLQSEVDEYIEKNTFRT